MTEINIPNLDPYRNRFPDWPHIEAMRDKLLEDLTLKSLIRQCKEIGKARMTLPGVEVEIEERLDSENLL